MTASWIVALSFFTVSTVLLTSGINALQSTSQAPANRVFFALTMAIAIWSAGMALSAAAATAAAGEVFRRISAVGWSTAYAILLHLILVVTGKVKQKRSFMVLLYTPALLGLLAFAVPGKLNPRPYLLQQTAYGWINVAQHNLWDWFFYAYYLGYSLFALWLLARWEGATQDQAEKKKARTLFLAILSALALGTLTDVILSSIFSAWPQMAPLIMLVPVLSIDHALKKDSFQVTEGVNRKTNYITLFASVLLYIILTALQLLRAREIGPLGLDLSVTRGIIIQIQMLLSVYLVLMENRPGYITSILLNSISLFNALSFLLRRGSLESLPGVISHVGVLVIIMLIRGYQERSAAFIKRISTQAVREKFYSKVFKQAPVGIAIFSGAEYTRDQELRDLNINPAYSRIVGRSKEELQTIDWTHFTHPDDLARDLDDFARLEQGLTDYYTREKRYLRPDGSTVWVELHISRFDGLDRKPGDHVSIISDITQRKEMEAALKYRNEHVLLTGLPNRSVLEKALEEDAARPLSHPRTLICVNLSALYTISLRYGYQYHQRMLKEIGAALKSLCEGDDRLFHTMEHRFVFYVQDRSDEGALRDRSEQIWDALRPYLQAHGIGVSMGILQINDVGGADCEDLLGKLMITSEMAAANNHTDHSVLFYSPELDLRVARESEIIEEMIEIAEGIGSERLYLQYQPIFDLTSNRICGFEALARLNSEEYGPVSPTEFILFAEKTNMIVPLGERIRFLALSFLRKLEKEGHDTISVSINVSVIQILSPGFAETFLKMIREMNVNPERVGIELTESVFATERAEMNTVINKLKAAGIKILIDDFGTGYSSFARQRDLNIDCLKIDKSFIDRLMELGPQETITGDMISMAHKLGHCVIAEGVEWEKQLHYLQEKGCDRIQGYLISKPLDEDLALDLLTRGI